MKRLYHPERLRGVEPRLCNFFEEWAKTGPFAVVIDPDGGVRTDARQAELYAAKKSRAKTAEESAHGRGCAVDAWPAVVVGGYVRGILLPESGPEARAMLLEYGLRGEAAGLRWGGRWTALYPPTKANPMGGDCPHLELPAWRLQPYPPEVQSSP